MRLKSVRSEHLGDRLAEDDNVIVGGQDHTLNVPYIVDFHLS
jgi:hypothetical protein